MGSVSLPDDVLLQIAASLAIKDVLALKQVVASERDLYFTLYA